MSLNGLDDAVVQEAYQKALSEGGYWFFLKYSTRDEVELLQQGSGGVAEAQEVVRSYGEESPLYGFIQYRRRKVLLKYLPEGTSRLLQARTAVHFTAIEDKFTPHDAVFAFATASELKESALSSEIALHTASSIKSASESHLSGIVEDDGDARSEATQRAEKVDNNTVTQRSTPSQRDDAQTRHEKVAEILSAMRKQEHPHSPPLGQHSRKPSDSTKNLQDPSNNTPEISPKPPSIYEFEPRASFSSMNGRASTQSLRPSTRDLNMAYEYKPKVKLGPRPSMDGMGRPSAAGTNGIFRPVSTLPAGLRMPPRKTTSGRPGSAHKNAQFESAPPYSTPLPPPPPTPTGHLGKAGSDASVSPASVRSTQSKQPTMTPEKKRLMKALELRKKQQAALSASKQSSPVPANLEHEFPVDASAEVNGTRCEVPQQDTLPRSYEIGTPLEHQSPQMRHDDDYSAALEPQDSPISAPEPSEGPSTKASSISEEDIVMQKPSHASEYTIKEASEHSSTSTEVPLVLDTTPQSPASPVQKSPESALISTNGEVVKLVPENSAPLEDEQTEDDRPLTVILSKPTQEEAAILEEPSERQQVEPAPFHREAVEPLTKVEMPEQKPRSPVLDKDSALFEDPNMPASRERVPKPQSNVYLAEESSSSEDMLPIQGTSGMKISTAQTDISAPVSATLTDDSLDHQMREDYAQMAVGLGLSDDLMPDVRDDNVPTPQEKKTAAPNVEKTDREVQEEYGQMALSMGLNNEANHHQSIVPAQPEFFDDSDVSKNAEPQRRSVREPQHGHTSTPLTASDSGTHHDDFSKESLEAPQQKPSQLETSFAYTESPEPSPVTGQLSTSTTMSSLGEPRIKRKVVGNALKRTSSPEQSDEQFLSDESFMEELKTVAVQEAKPISVSKSPIKPVFSRSGSDQHTTDKVRPLRSVSSPLRDFQGEVTPPLPTPGSIRSFSSATGVAPFAHVQPPNPATKKLGVSSSISQRIRALEQLSSRPTSPTLQSTPQTTFISINDRKSSFPRPTGSPEIGTISGRATPVTGTSPTSANVNNMRLLSKAPKPRPESISVTATIIRDPKHPSPDGPLRSKDSPVQENLIQSPLQIEHHTMSAASLPPLEPPRPQFARNASNQTASSGGIERGQPLSPKQTRRESFTSWRSGSSRNGSDIDLPLDGKPGPSDGNAKDEKRDSRGRRFLKRMSGSLNTSKRGYGSALSPAPKEASIVEHQEPVDVMSAASSSLSSAVDLGDLNVQFPDTLLWKRRHMCLDETGSLILEPSASERNPRIMTKRFRMDEFRAPYIPDQDRQELPHSIILDFKNGSTLQCACETRREQVEVFNALRQAYTSQTS